MNYKIYDLRIKNIGEKKKFLRIFYDFEEIFNNNLIVIVNGVNKSVCEIVFEYFFENDFRCKIVKILKYFFR